MIRIRIARVLNKLADDIEMTSQAWIRKRTKILLALASLIFVAGKFPMPKQQNLIFTFAFALFAASASAESLVYIVTDSQQFGTVDLNTGAFSPNRR